MAQKRGLKRQDQDGTPGAAATPNPPKLGRPHGSRKTTYAIDLTGWKGAIDKIADLYGVKPATIIEDLTALYLASAFAPHFSKLQGQLAAERRQREEDALREIAPLFKYEPAEALPGVAWTEAGDELAAGADHGREEATE